MHKPGHPEAGAAEHRSRSAAAEISTGMVQLTSRYTGRGPTRARTTVNTNLVVVVLEDTLTKAEHNLVAAEQSDAVTQMRRTFREMMRDEAVDLVEQATGRRVAAFLSDIDPESNVAAEVFVLEPVPESGRAFTAEAAAAE